MWIKRFYWEPSHFIKLHIFVFISVNLILAFPSYVHDNLKFVYAAYVFQTLLPVSVSSNNCVFLCFQRLQTVG